LYDLWPANGIGLSYNPGPALSRQLTKLERQPNSQQARNHMQKNTKDHHKHKCPR